MEWDGGLSTDDERTLFFGQTLALNFNITSSAPRRLHLDPRVFQINAGTNILFSKNHD